jgi:HKD family nuclease
MSDFNLNFLDSLKTGFIDKTLPSFQEYHPEFLVNDKELGKRVLTSIKKELNDCDDFWFSVAFITTSGLAVLQTLFKELENRGIRGKILVSQYLNFTQPEALRKLLSLSHIETRIAVSGNFHSKGYLFKKENYYNLIVGSSNLTASALCSNKEWNLKISAISGSSIIGHALNEFQSAFDQAVVVDENYIKRYSAIYKEYRAKSLNHEKALKELQPVEIKPNKMQSQALVNLVNLRKEGKRKSLLISATGTGKTFLSAFDIKQCNPKRVLFVVHRLNIAKKTMETYKAIFGDSKSMGLYSGSNKDLDADFIFSTVQTISKDEHLKLFTPSSFDYIVIDETHRAGASSYQRVLDYFDPSFLLGMTATPERMDGLDIFKLFDYNIAYEIRLHAALEQEMLSPFHYYGVTDISVDGVLLEEKADFNRLVADERVDRIIEQTKFFGCDDGEVSRPKKSLHDFIILV